MAGCPRGCEVLNHVVVLILPIIGMLRFSATRQEVRIDSQYGSYAIMAGYAMPTISVTGAGWFRLGIFRGSNGFHSKPFLI